MRLSYVVLLTVPAAAFGAGISQGRLSQPMPSAVPVPVAQAIADVAPALALVRGGERPGRAQMFETALAETGAEVLLGDATCTEALIETDMRSTRYASGSRRDENPTYRQLLDQQAELNTALAALGAEESTLRAALQLHSEREALQQDRIDQTRRDLRAAQRELDHAREDLRATEVRLARASSASAAVERYSRDRVTLDSEVQTLQGRIRSLAGELARLQTMPDLVAGARQALIDAEARLVAATSSAQSARQAMKASRRDPSISEAQRNQLRASANTTRSNLEAAERDVLAARRALEAETAASSASSIAHLKQRLQQAERELAATVHTRSNLRPPGADLHNLAAKVSELQRRHTRHVTLTERAANTTAHVSQQLLAQEAHSDDLLQRRLAQESSLSALTAEVESQRQVLQVTTAEASGQSAFRTRTLWQEASTPVETRSRTCTVSATVIWDGDTFHQFSAQTSDTDTTHGANLPAGIEADPLSYDRSDSDRIEDADADLLAQILAVPAIYGIADASL
jgi:hypothetical protein